MATKMTGETTPDDLFLSELIKNSEPEPAPSDLQETIMLKVLATQKPQSLSVFNLPRWVKWGVPSVALICSLVLLFIPKREKSLIQLPDLQGFETFGERTDTWFVELCKTIELPDFSLPDYAVWLGIGAVVLFWAFVALNHYLDKRFSH